MEESKMYFKDTESNERPSGVSYRALPNGNAFVMIRKNIRSENRQNEDGGTQNIYVYDEVQFETQKDESYVNAHADDLYRMLSGTTPTIEERLNALEKAIMEIGGLL